jgi:Uma2 family endonuclease
MSDADTNLPRKAERHASSPRCSWPDIVVSRPVNRSHRGVDDTAELVVELRCPGDESYEKLPWYAARGITEMLIVDPATRRFELYRNGDGIPIAVTPDDDGGVTLDTLGVRLLTVASGEGPRLHVTTDTENTDC